MKKKFMITAAIAPLTLVGGYLGKAAADRTYGLSDLQLANAEALADPDEGGSSESWDCWSELKPEGGGVWVCGNPCKYEPHKAKKSGKSKCYKNN